MAKEHRGVDSGENAALEAEACQLTVELKRANEERDTLKKAAMYFAKLSDPKPCRAFEHSHCCHQKNWQILQSKSLTHSSIHTKQQYVTFSNNIVRTIKEEN